MADQEINIKLNGLAEIKSQLRELKGELASATDPQQMAELAAKAGELSDQLKDANERVSVFASGSPFEQTNNALGLMGSQLMSLDFEGAAESSKLFASAAKGINGDMIAKSLKSLGTVVVQVGKAFMSVGLSLLTNPIFLIAAAIAALVAIIVLLMNKLGILKPILDAIGKVFGWIMDMVDALVQGFRMLTDWLGLTANAAEDSAKRQIAASEKTLEVLERTSERRIDSMDHEIRLAKIAGEDVAIAEAKKQKYIIETTKVRIAELEKQIKIHAKLGDLEDEDLKKLKDSLAEQKKALREAGQDFEALRAENRKKVEDNAKKVSDNAKKVREEQWKEQQKRDEETAKRNAAAVKAEIDAERWLIEQTDQLRAEEEAKKKAAEEKAQADAMAAAQFQGELFAFTTQQGLDAQKEADDKKIAQAKAYAEARENLGSTMFNSLKALEQGLAAAGVKTAGLQKTIALVQIATDTAKAMSSIIAGATAAAAASGPAAPFVLAGYIASGIATVLGAVGQAYAVLKKAPPLGGSVSGSAPTASNTSTQAMTPNVQLFGQNNNANNMTSAQDVETTQNMVVKAVVVESDITNSQSRVRKMAENATL